MSLEQFDVLHYEDEDVDQCVIGVIVHLEEDDEWGGRYRVLWNDEEDGRARRLTTSREIGLGGAIHRAGECTRGSM